MIYLFTGQPHSGKTTLSKYLRTALLSQNLKKPIYIIDGDYLRKIYKNIDYSVKGRTENINIAHSIAIYLNSQDCDVIIAMVSPFMELREELKSKHGALEIYVHTKDIRGRENYYTTNYERPISNFIEIDTTSITELESVNELLGKIQDYHLSNIN